MSMFQNLTIQTAALSSRANCLNKSSNCVFPGVNVFCVIVSIWFIDTGFFYIEEEQLHIGKFLWYVKHYKKVLQNNCLHDDS